MLTWKKLGEVSGATGLLRDVMGCGHTRTRVYQNVTTAYLGFAHTSVLHQEGKFVNRYQTFRDKHAEIFRGHTDVCNFLQHTIGNRRVTGWRDGFIRKKSKGQRTFVVEPRW